MNEAQWLLSFVQSFDDLIEVKFPRVISIF